MSDRLRITRILPTTQNAEAIVEMTRQDLLRADVAEEVVDSIAGEARHIQAQRLKIARHRDRYLGAIAGRQLPFGYGAPLLGFAKVNEWNAADQAAYETGEAAGRRNEQGKRDENSLEGNPLGIFALLVASDMLHSGDHLRVGDKLLEATLRRAAGREVRVGLHESDPLLPVFDDHGFQPTDALGVPIPEAPDYQVRLYIRE